MESVGELLRNAREAQEKTIDEVAKVTKMSGQILEALEDDRFSALPAPVYVKGQLRTYARYLGLDEDEVVQKYLRFTQQQQQDSDELDEWDAVELELAEQKKTAGRRWVWIAVAAAAVVVAVVLIVNAIGNDGEDTSPAEPAPVVTETPQQAAPADTMIEWHKLELLAVARERTWVRVTVDGTPVSDLTLDAGEQRRWEGDEYFELDVGNGGGLELYLDGDFLGTAGTGRRLVEGLIVNEDGMSE